MFLLEQVYKVNFGGNLYLQLLVDNPFQSYFIQMVWEYGLVTIYRSRFVDFGTDTRIALEKGTLSSTESNRLKHKITKLKPIAFAPPHDLQGRDGDVYKLTIGQGYSTMTYKWWDVDRNEQWEKLEELAQSIVSVVHEQNYTDTTIFEYEEEIIKERDSTSILYFYQQITK